MKWNPQIIECLGVDRESAYTKVMSITPLKKVMDRQYKHLQQITLIQSSEELPLKESGVKLLI